MGCYNNSIRPAREKWNEERPGVAALLIQEE